MFLGSPRGGADSWWAFFGQSLEKAAAGSNETFSTPHPGQASPGYRMAWRGDHSMSGSDEDG